MTKLNQIQERKEKNRLRNSQTLRKILITPKANRLKTKKAINDNIRFLQVYQNNLRKKERKLKKRRRKNRKNRKKKRNKRNKNQKKRKNIKSEKIHMNLQNLLPGPDREIRKSRKIEQKQLSKFNKGLY